MLEVTELYQLVSQGTENIDARKQSRMLRKVALDSYSSGQGFTKLAFDTRRVDQETQYIPRRGLQNYQRSEAFLSEAISQKIKNSIFRMPSKKIVCVVMRTCKKACQHSSSV